MNKNFIWNTIGTICYLASLWLITIIITIFVGYEENGVFTIALSLVNIFYVFSSYGLRGYQVSDINHKYSNNTYIFNRFFTIAVSFVAIMITSFVMQYNLYTILIIMLFMIYKSFEALSDVYHGVMQEQGNLYYAGISLTLKGVGTITLFTLVLYFTKQMRISLLVSILVCLLIFLFFDLQKSKYGFNFRGIFTLDNFKHSFNLMKVTLPMMLFMLTTPLLASVPKIILEKYYNVEILGIYSSLSAPSVIIPTLINCIMTPLLPKWTILHMQKKRKELTKSFVASFIISIAIGGLALICSIFLGKFFLVLLFGEKMNEYYIYLNHVIVISTLTALISCCSGYFIIARKLYALLGISFLGCAICLLTSFLLIPGNEIAGVCYSLIICESIQVSLLVIYIIFSLIKLRKASILELTNNEQI